MNQAMHIRQIAMWGGEKLFHLGQPHGGSLSAGLAAHRRKTCWGPTESEIIPATGPRNLDAKLLNNKPQSIQNDAHFPWPADHPATTGIRTEFRMDTFPSRGVGKGSTLPIPSSSPINSENQPETTTHLRSGTVYQAAQIHLLRASRPLRLDSRNKAIIQ